MNPALIKVGVIVIGTLLAISGVTAFALQHAIKSKGKLEERLEQREMELDGWIKSYQYLYEEQKRVDGIVANVRRRASTYRQQAGELAQELRRVSANNQCAQEAVPDDYLDTLLGGLPSRRETTSTGVPDSDGLPP